MKVIAVFTSDWHFRDTVPRCRIDDYFQAQKNKLDQVKEIQRLNNNCPVFDCGDLLDKCKSSPFLEGWLMDNLPDNFYTIAGNHDLPNHRIEDLENSSLGVLIKSGKIKLLSCLENSPIFSVYGFNYGDFIASQYLINNKSKKIALVHEFISLDRFPGSITPEQLTEKLPGFDFIFCGHNHINFGDYVNDCQVINVGSMMRMDADQVNYEPGFYVMYEDYSIKRILFDIEKDVIDRKYLDQKSKTSERLLSFIESVTGKYEIGNNFKENLRKSVFGVYNIGEGVKKKISQALGE